MVRPDIRHDASRTRAAAAVAVVLVIAMGFTGRGALVSGASGMARPAADGSRAAGEVTRWNQVATDAMAAAQMDPLTESRILAILHTSVHDAVNAVAPRYRPYRFAGRAPGASAEAAVHAAAHAVLVALMPQARATFDVARHEGLARAGSGDAVTRGLAAGETAARENLAARTADNADRPTPYQPGTTPGAYRPTPPDFTPAFLTHWGQVTPFVLRDAAQFRPSPPPAVGSGAALRDLREVQAIGGATSSLRTAEGTEIARFWYENSTQGWNRIAREVAAAERLDAGQTARLLALVNLAMADGFIGGFEAKYHYNYWRPATAIREAGETDWLSVLPTPPVPDYPSTHTVLGAAAATVLERFFDTDFVSFSMTSGAPYAGITRRFYCFTQAARENGASRVLAGIHFATAVRAGYTQGEQIGAWVFEHALQPVAAQPETTLTVR